MTTLGSSGIESTGIESAGMEAVGADGRLPQAAWKAIVAEGEPRDYRAGAALFLEGDGPGPAFAVLSGRVRVEAAGAGIAVDIRILGPGTIVGELAAIDGLPRSATAVAEVDTTVVAIEVPRFNQLLVDHPLLAMSMLRLLTERLRVTTAARVNDSPTDIEAKLANLLVDLARTRGCTAGTIVLLDVAQSELASLLRADPEATSTAIARLRARGAVLPGRKCLHVTNMHALEVLAGRAD